MRQAVVYPNLEAGGWIAEVPSLPGCISIGATKDEAIVNMRDAIESWTMSAQENGMEIPEETFDVQVCLI